MGRSLGVIEQTREVTLEDIVHILTAMLQYGYGRCEIQIVAHRFDTVRPSPLLKGGKDVATFADCLTKVADAV